MVRLVSTSESREQPGRLAPGKVDAAAADGGDVLAELETILASPDFDVPGRARNFLRYVVEETLAGRADRIKAYAIALEVFGRDSSFDAQNDPVVRIEAGRLRRALERYYLTSGRGDPIVISIPKGGYVPLFTQSDAPAEPASAEPEASAPPTGPAPVPIRWGWNALAAVSVVLVILIAVLWVDTAEQANPNQGAGAPVTAAAVPVLRVEPFDDVTGTRESAILARGLTEEIIGQIARFKEVTVVLGASPRQHGYALTAKVQTDGNGLRLVARLENVADRVVLWSQVYEQPLRVHEIVQIQASIAQSIATVLAQPFGVIQQAEAARIGSDPPDNWEAYSCTLSYYAYQADLDAQTHASVQGCLLRAVERYPDYATAWALLALTYVDEVRYRYHIGAEGPPPLDRAIKAAVRAVTLDSQNMRALEAQMIALFFDGQAEAALRVGEQAIAINPNDARLLGEYGLRLALTGDWERGADFMHEAMARNAGPRGYYATGLSVSYYMRRDYASAARWIELEPVKANPVYRIVAAAICGQLGSTADCSEDRDWIVSNAPDLLAGIHDELDARNFGAADAAHFIDGLRKAGLSIPERS